MHRPPLQNTAESPIRPLRGQHSTAAFSLVEVTLAIGIIAFAFVALFGLLPTGLNVFRGANDTANEMWIMQDMNSMLQVTDWSKVRDLGSDRSDTIFYFDEEGRMTDWVSKDKAGTTDSAVIAKRLYAVKLVIDDVKRPEGEKIPNAYRVVLVFAPFIKPESMKIFGEITLPDDVKTKITRGSEIHTRALLLARMDSEK